LFVTVTVYTAFVPRTTELGPVFTTDRSLSTVGQLTPVCTLLVLLVPTGSGLLALIVAVFVSVLALQFWITGRLNVAVMIGVDWPAGRLAMLHWSAPPTTEHEAPEEETNVRPAGIGSLTTMFVAVAGPKFVAIKE
jgi:hypothetical protein